MKHSYTIGCDCKRCGREAIRRSVQGLADFAKVPAVVRQRRGRKPAWVADRDSYPRKRRQPIVGSAEWAETRGDDLGYSGDY